LIRSVCLDDLDGLYRLSLNNSLLNLPTNKDILYKKINTSIASFACKKQVDDRQFIFVLEDQETGQVTGTSTIFSHYADDAHPLYSFTVYDSNNPPPDGELKAGHQLLRLCRQTSGISALGGLVVDSRYRGLPEKRGKQISLIRFVFLGMFHNFFNPTILSELMAPTEPDGSNPFWKAIGQKYSGFDYESVFQAARLKDRSFIQEYFPTKDILLPPNLKHIHRTIDSVQDSGRAQQYMVTQQGFKYHGQVDPMDGGLQYTARIDTIKSIQNGRYYYCDQMPDNEDVCVSALIGSVKQNHFYGCQVPVSIHDDTVLLPSHVMDLVPLSPGDQLYVSLI